MIGSVIIRFMTSRAGIVVMLVAAMFAWHTLDKKSAVRKAVVGYVADVELVAAEAEAAALRDQLARSKKANAVLAMRIAETEKEVADVEAAFRAYQSQNQTNCGPIVTRDLLDVLRSD